MSLRLLKRWYPPESLEAAALALGSRAEVTLEARGDAFLVEVSPEALEGEFANEALSHAYRQKVVRFHRGLTQPTLGGLLARGFAPAPADPLEELEPQVKADRARDAEELLAAARELK